MIYTLIILSLLSSILFSLLLRRFDRSSLRMAQIKRMGEIYVTQLKEATQKNVQEIKDAALEFELLVRQSKQTQNELSATLKSYQEKVAELENDQRLISEISAEIAQISAGAQSVGLQVERLDLGLERLQLAQKEIQEVQNQMDDLTARLSLQEKDAQIKLGNAVAGLVKQAQADTDALVARVQSSYEILQNDGQTIINKVAEASTDVDLVLDRIAQFNQRLDDKWLAAENIVEHRFSNFERKIQERTASMEAGLASIRNTAVEALQSEISRIRADLEHFNLDAIAKRDDIINQSKKMLTGMDDQIQRFQEKYLSAENRLNEFVEEQKRQLMDRIDQSEETWRDMDRRRAAELKDRLTQLDREMTRIRSEVSAGLQAETESQREEIRKFADLNLTAIRAEMGELSENLEILAGDIKQHMRQEGDQAIGRIAEARQKEESKLHKTIEDIQEIKHDLSDRLDALQSQIRDVNRNRARIEEVSEKSIEDIRTLHEALKADVAAASQETLTVAEQKMQTLQEQLATQLDTRIEEARHHFKKLISEANQEIQQVRSSREEALREIRDHESSLQHFMEKIKVIERIDDYAVKLDETLEVFTARLEAAREENSKIDEYMHNIESMRQYRKDVDSELKLLEIQKRRIDESEREIHSIDRHVAELLSRIDQVSSREKLLSSLEERLDQVDEFRKEMEVYAAGLLEKRKFVETTMTSLEKSRKEARDAAENASKLLAALERAELRQTELHNELKSLESRSSQLGQLKNEFKKIESRFEQMDGLLLDLSEKSGQISTMYKRTDEMKDKSLEVKSELESLIGEAEEKMDRLGSLFGMIDRGMERAGEGELAEVTATPVRAKKGKGALTDWKRDSILQLYLNHKWDPELIARKMKLDPAVVRTVINSA
ncbi:MAG: hypothetical protein HS115_07315 [Spirochaetales bacterium]|nr:hypothetical protein [Spirochaetales bacterium]